VWTKSNAYSQKKKSADYKKSNMTISDRPSSVVQSTDVACIQPQAFRASPIFPWGTPVAQNSRSI